MLELKIPRKYVWKDPSTKNYRRFRKAERLKEKAQAIGKIKYQGTPCAKGHSGVRYAADGSCVDCASIRREKHSRRTRHREDGKFQGVPCKHGHTGLRYLCNNACVECEAIRRARKRRVF